VDDDESIRAIHAAMDKGVNFFDVSDVYGAGHGEKVLGVATHDRRDRVVLATKFGAVVDEDNGRVVGRDVSPTHIRKACEDSLRRLGTDYIDLYQLHIPVLPAVRMEHRFRGVCGTVRGVPEVHRDPVHSQRP
jgi:aryl-alcohol dehydrogenase-like predicted oxidoreductase